MQNTLYTEIIGSMAEKGFSLDELVIRGRELFETKAMAKVVSMLLRLTGEYLCFNLMGNRKGWRPAACCGMPPTSTNTNRAADSNECRDGGDQMVVHECRNCGKSIVLLREFLGLERFASKTAEMEKMVAEVVREQSYRRTSRHLDLIGEIPVPKSTAHRWVMESDCDELRVDGKGVGIVVADGTATSGVPMEGKTTAGS